LRTPFQYFEGDGDRHQDIARETPPIRPNWNPDSDFAYHQYLRHQVDNVSESGHPQCRN